MKNFLQAVLIFLSFSAYAVEVDPCHMEVSPNEDNFIIG